MNKTKRNNIFLFVFILVFVPTSAFAQSDNSVQTSANGANIPTATINPNDTSSSALTGGSGAVTIGVPQGFGGVFSCNQNGANAMSVGALGATGGVYVPVADATVELNTGTLVYKECVLREVVDAQRMAATAGFTQQATNQIQTGRNGAPLYTQKPNQEKVSADDQIVQDDLQNNGTLNTVTPAFKAKVAQAIAQGYVRATRQSNSQFTCTIPDDVTTVLNGQAANALGDLAALQNPACNPYGATILANDEVMGDIAAGNVLIDQELLWGNGYYPVTTGGLNPLTQQIVTPSSNVYGSYSQVLGSAFNQLQNANDIGQMVGALFAGISTQVLSGTGGGLTGLTQPIGTQPSYLQQAVNQASQNLQQQVSNAALANLNAALQVEQSYFNIMSSIAGTLTGAISQLRGAENTCYQQIAQALCPSGVSASGTCTDTNGAQLRVATSTQFSQPVISSQIAALASTTAQNLVVSQQALTLINQLIHNVSGTSADSQAVAIQQLNVLIANNELHTPANLTTAQTQQQSVQNAMTTLVQNTPELWAGSDPLNSSSTNIPWNGSVGATLNASSPGVGWCNFQNQTTLSAWEQKWRI
ncbi:MAG TPA: hypothetical protein VMH91_00985 [Candidatus Paceibacterota bacterium]|nr:hypothetical protein [Candidatus Paceibacterota bacterium]